MSKKIKKTISDSFNYLFESRNYFYAILFLFISGIILGAVLSGQLSFLDKYLKELIEKTKGLGMLDMILFIIKNNLQVASMAILLGVVFGIFPVFASFSNGIVLGYVMKLVWIKDGILQFWRIFPHGIFELPAIFIAMTLGLKLGMFIFAREKKKEFFWRFKNSLILFLIIVLPLLLIAGIIEGVLVSVMR